jgi:ABC-type Mn2+/Zn2+ transport system permease subunit
VSILKIRWISIGVSFTFQCIMIFKLNTQSSMYGFFYQPAALTALHEYEKNNLRKLYLVSLLVALVVNISAKLYSYHLNKKMESFAVHIFTVQYLHLNNYQQKEKVFIVS